MRRAAYILLAVTLASCVNADGRVRPATTELARDRYHDVVAVGDLLVAGRTGPTAAKPNDLYAAWTWEVVEPATGSRETLDLPDRDTCDKTKYVVAFPLGATSVGFHRECLRIVDGRPVMLDDLVSYDLGTKRVRVLTEVEPAASYARVGADEYLAEHDSQICGRLVRYRDGDVVPLGITLEADGWPLDADRAPGEEECRAHGLVTTLAVSASGEVAFLASTEARGKAGHGRARSKYSVYVVGTGGVALAIAEAPGHPRALVWSADGSTLYLSVDERNDGVYAVTRDGTVTLLTSTVADTLAVSGDSLVILEDEMDDSMVRRLALLPLR